MAIILEPRPVELETPTASERVATAPARRPAPKMGPVAALLIDHVTKRFVVGRKKKSVTAVDDVSIRIERGEVYGVLGANGGGKSTLIRLVSTLLTLDTGKVEVFGHDIERDEMAIIEHYLPAKLGEAEIIDAIDAAIAATGASGPADMGKLMGVLKPALAGKADMGEVSKLVKQRLAG